MTIDKKFEWKINVINEDIIKCNKCKKTHTSSIDDVSTKNPNYYYKTCKKCRQYFTDYIKKKNIDFTEYKPRLL